MARLPAGTLAKYHALGNDYLVAAWAPTWGRAPKAGLPPGLVRALCERQRGVGADGLVVVAPPPPASLCDAQVAIHNADGGLAERSGNGLRIAAQALFDWGGAAPPRARLATAAGAVAVCRCRRLTGGGGVLEAEMGRPAFGAAAVGAQGLPPGAASVQAGLPVAVDLVSVGNPHAVWWAEGLSPRAFAAGAERVSKHPRFPRGINVQMAAPRGRRRLDILVWERGVGPTQASGTSACAVVASALLRGRVDTPVRVAMPGGAVVVSGSLADGLRLAGPVHPVMVVRPLSAAWRARAALSAGRAGGGA